MEPNIKIYISCHKPSQMVTGPYFYPIQVGAALSCNRMEGMLHDDVGENISEKNPMFCELTAQYWAWKNDDADYYGFCHYRRYFSFSPETYPEDATGSLNFDALGKQTLETLCLTDFDRIRNVILNADFLIGSPADFLKIHMPNLYVQYETAPLLHGKDLHLVLDILKERSPEYASAADEYMNGHYFYPCNMFIMKKELFQAYCSWLFPILEEAEQKIDFQDYSVESRRVIGHLSERLLGVFYTYIRKHRPQCRIKTLQRALIHNTEPLVYPKPVGEMNPVAAFFSFGDSCVPFAAGALRSLAEHTDPHRSYDLMILHRDISEKSEKRLQTVLEGYPNISLRLIDVSALAGDIPFAGNHQIGVDTFYRLLAPELFREYQKILYLDADMIFLRDVGELYDTELGDSLLGCAVDPDHVGQYCGGAEDTREYTDTVLKQKKPLEYFQAGVILMNLAALRSAFQPGELISFAAKGQFRDMVQDALNIFCEGRVTFLDPRWNVLTDCMGQRIQNSIRFAPKRIIDGYQESRMDPYIIHYAGAEKPWDAPLSDMAEFYWEYARKTVFYEAVLANMCQSFKEKPDHPDLGVMGALKIYFRKILNRIFPGRFPPDPNAPDIGVWGAIKAHFR